MRVRSYEELQETGEHKKESLQKEHLRFEEAFELRSLGLIVYAVAVIRFVFDINIYTFKNSTRRVIQ